MNLAHRTPSPKCFEVLLGNPAGTTPWVSRGGAELVSPPPSQFLQICPEEASGVLPGWWNLGESKGLGVRGRGVFFLLFCFFLTKILRKTQGGRGEEGDPIELNVHRLFQRLRGLLKEKWSRVLPPSLRFPSSRAAQFQGSLALFFFFFLNPWGNGGWSGEERGETNMDKDRDRTGDTGSHRERK